jgi:DNA-directed RNA polymerase specialized sigma24 family protein
MGRSGDTDGQDGRPAVPAAALASPEQLDRMERSLIEVLDHAARFVRQNTDDEDEAEDALQDIGSYVWETWTSNPSAFKVPDNHEAYAYTVVRNYFVNLSRKHERWDKVIDPGADVDEVEGEVAHPQDSPLDDVVVGRFQEHLEALANKLPDNVSRCWWMWQKGRKLADIARELRIKKKTAENYVAYGNTVLFEGMNKYLEANKS